MGLGKSGNSCQPQILRQHPGFSWETPGPSWVGSECQVSVSMVCLSGRPPQALTLLRNDAKGDTKTCILDELHNVSVRHVDDRLAVDC